MRWITILDLKFGRIDVSPVRLAQTMIYGLGVYREHVESHFSSSSLRFRFVIAQPRSLLPGPRIKKWECSLEELLAFEDELRVAVRMVNTNPQFVLGDWCTYCPALGECPASKDAWIAAYYALLAGQMTPEQAAQVLKLEVMIKKKLKDAEGVVKEALLRGQAVDGVGLFTGVKYRQWRDEEQAKDALVENIGVSVLKAPTPAQAEKYGEPGKRVVELLAYQPPGEPQVGLAGDKRAPYVAKSGEQMFGS
jgi:hypothetical protein